MFNWFKNKANPAIKTRENLLAEQRLEISGDIIPLINQYKMMTIRGIMITHEDGNFNDDMVLPENLLLDIRRKLNNVSVLIENDWYDHKWIFGSIVDTIYIDYDEMDELIIPDVVEKFKRALNHGRINGQTELVILGSPVLINILLPFIDTLEVYASKLTPIDPVKYSGFARMVNTNAEVAKTLTLGGCNYVVTKHFEINSIKHFNLVNLKPLEIKDGE